MEGFPRQVEHSAQQHRNSLSHSTRTHSALIKGQNRRKDTNNEFMVLSRLLVLYHDYSQTHEVI